MLTARPLRTSDRPLLIEAFGALSRRSRYQRFFTPLQRLSVSLLDRLTDLDGRDRFAWAVLGPEGDDERLVAVGRWFRAGNRVSAEVALAVVDRYQGRGLGTVVLRALAERAVEAGIVRFDGLVLSDNVAMGRLLRRAGARLQHCEAGTLAFEIDLEDFVGWPPLAVVANPHPGP